MNDLDIAQYAARRGAAVLLHHWEILGKDDADLKARNDWVSAADRESEQAIVDAIREHRPDDAFLGEETGMTAGASADRVWIIDPLDGTSNYLQHFPMWCVSIALRERGETTTAMVYEPLRELFFTGTRGGGAFRNGERMHISTHERLEGSFLATGFPFRAQEYVERYVAIFTDVIRVSKGVRRAGSAALDLAYTAAGVFDGFFEMHLAPWDVAAGALLVTEAGGIVTDFSGGQRWLDRGNIAGATPKVHAELMEVIARHVTEDDLDHRKGARLGV
ncbi:MAG: inositol monophosphatase family protein [Thermoanaerobaculia bacterium]